MYCHQQIDWGAWGAIIASFTALFIALFGDWLKRIIFKPDLNITLDLVSPDSHKIELIGGGFTYYFRMKINNVGNYPAYNVEVKALELKKEDIKGNYIIDKNFLPLNLIWANTLGREIFKPIIHQRLFAHCDLCHTVRDKENLLLIFNTFPIPNKVSLDRYPTIITPGNYQLKVTIAANNFNSKYFYFQINFTGKWFDKEEEMFQDGIAIKVK